MTSGTQRNPHVITNSRNVGNIVRIHEGLGMRLTMTVIEFLAAVGFVDDATTAREPVLPVEELSCTYTVLVTSQAEGLVFWLNIFVSSSWE